MANMKALFGESAKRERREAIDNMIARGDYPHIDWTPLIEAIKDGRVTKEQVVSTMMDVINNSPVMRRIHGGPVEPTKK